MICKRCGGDIADDSYIVDVDGRPFHYSFCSPKAERSGVPKGCLPSTNCSAGAGADARSNELNNSVVPREKAEPPGTVALLACPFCASRCLKFDRTRIIGMRDEFHVLCITCGSQSGDGETTKEAVANWNLRAGEVARDPGGAPPSGERALARNDQAHRSAPGVTVARKGNDAKTKND